MHRNKASLFDNLARGNLEAGTILIAFAVCKLSTNSSLPPAFGGPVSELCDKRLARSQGARSAILSPAPNCFEKNQDQGYDRA